MNWQPIDTAPKDGTRVLLWDGVTAVIGHWQDGTENGWPTGWRSGIFVQATVYTHWMAIVPPKQKRKTAACRRGLLYIFGGRDGFPASGVAFITPVSRYGNLTKVHEAMKVCNDRWPNQGRKPFHYGLTASGDAASGNEATDRDLALRTRAWDGARYEWDFELDKFIPLERKDET